MKLPLIAAIACTLAAPAAAGTVRLYIPGSAPCAGACSFEWSRAQFGVADGNALPMVVPAGSISTQMTGARGGVPFVARETRRFARDEPAIGYPVRVNGTSMWMVRLVACLNWELVQLPVGATAQPGLAVAPAAGAYGFAGGGFGGAGGGGYAAATASAIAGARSQIVVWTPPVVPPLVCDCTPVVPPDCPPVPVPTPSPVPLPASGLILLLGLAGALIMKRTLK